MPGRPSLDVVPPLVVDPVLPVVDPVLPVVDSVPEVGCVPLELAAPSPLCEAPLECTLVRLAVAISGVLAATALWVDCVVCAAALGVRLRAACWTTATFAESRGAKMAEEAEAAARTG